MRIIGGSFKGIKIFEAFDKNTRPLRDLVKESILNILEYSKDSKINFNNSLILDFRRYWVFWLRMYLKRLCKSLLRGKLPTINRNFRQKYKKTEV